MYIHVHVYVGSDENILSNLRQYGLQDRYVDVLVADAAHCMWRQAELFEAIITDRKTKKTFLCVCVRARTYAYTHTHTYTIPPPPPPTHTHSLSLSHTHTHTAPYGIREGGKKLGSKNATPSTVPPEQYVITCVFILHTYIYTHTTYVQCTCIYMLHVHVYLYTLYIVLKAIYSHYTYIRDHVH